MSLQPIGIVSAELPGAPLVIRNLLTHNQQTLDTDTAGWVANSNCTIARTVSYYSTAPASLQLTASAAVSWIDVKTSTMPAVVAGSKLFFSAQIRTTTAGASAGLLINWYDSGYNFVSPQFSTGLTGTLTQNSFSAVSSSGVTITPPTNAAYAEVVVSISGSIGSSSTHQMDDLWLYRSDLLSTVLLQGIGSAEALGSPTVSLANSNQTITLTGQGIGSAGAFGSPTVNTNRQYIYPGGIASAEGFGLLTLPVPLTPTELIRSEISHSHTAVSKVEVLSAAGPVMQELPVISGSVTFDVHNSYLGTCTFTVVDADNEFDSHVRPGGFEFRLSRGVLIDEVTTWQSLGIYTVNTDAFTATSQTYTCTGFDRSRRISRAAFVDYYVVAAGTNYATAIQDLIDDRWPSGATPLTYNFATTTITTPLLVFKPQEDPWAKAQEMAASLGMEVFFDRDGTCVLRPIIDPVSAPVTVTYIEGDNAELLDVDKNRTDEGAYSHIVIVGASSGSTAPVLAEAKDLNLASPTWIDGPFGDVPLFITSGYVLTLAQAQAQADAELARRSGLVEQVTLSLLVDPTLFVGDVIYLTSGTGRIDERYIIEQITIPLANTDSVSAAMRKRQATS